MAFECFACSTTGENGETIDFPTLKDLKVHEMTGHPRPEKVLPVDPRPPSLSATEKKALEQMAPLRVDTPTSVLSTPPVVWKPPTLKYKWEGKCKKCTSDLRTIEVKGEEKNTVVAYCVNCDEETSQEKVMPIDQQIGEKRVLAPSVPFRATSWNEFETNVKGKKK